MQLERLIAEYGLAALMIGAGIEGETVVVLGGVFAHRGSFSPGAAVAVAAIGSFVADQLFFLVGRRFSDHRRVARLRQHPAYARAAGLFARYPIAFVFGFRFVYGLRTVSPIAIGTTPFPVGRFALLNALAAMLWASVFITLGYSFGAGIETLFGRIHGVQRLALPIVAVGACAALALWLMRRHRGAASDVPSSADSHDRSAP